MRPFLAALAIAISTGNALATIAQIEPNQNKDADPGNDLLPNIFNPPPDVVKKIRFEFMETIPIQWVAPAFQSGGGDLATEKIEIKMTKIVTTISEGKSLRDTVVFQTTADVLVDAPGFYQIPTPVTLGPGLYDLTISLVDPGPNSPAFSIAQYTLDPLTDLPIVDGPFTILGGDNAGALGQPDTLISAQIGFIPAPSTLAVAGICFLSRARRRRQGD